MKYYADKNDFIYCEDKGKVYAYNYVNKAFTLTDTPVDLMDWHEFPESDLEKNINNNKQFFI